jgi:hypothetical protein
MNKRIKELAEQASEIDGDDLLYYHPVFAEKLAKLIVQECAKSLWTEECHNSDLALEEFERNSAKIKQHFGVEE